MAITDLALSISIRTIFLRYGINTVEELCLRSEEDISKMKGIGSHKMNEILKALKKNNLKLSKCSFKEREIREKYKIVHFVVNALSGNSKGEATLYAFFHANLNQKLFIGYLQVTRKYAESGLKDEVEDMVLIKKELFYKKISYQKACILFGSKSHYQNFINALVKKAIAALPTAQNP